MKDLIRKFTESDDRWIKTFSYIYERTPFLRIHYELKLRGTTNCVFIWIPKTAGTSIFTWLKEQAGMLMLLERRQYRSFPNKGIVTFGHVHYPSLVSAGFVNKSYDKKSYKFAVKRNPYLRAVSLYKYLKVRSKYSGEFVRFLSDVRLNRPPMGLYNTWGLSQTNPQVDWIIGEQGKFFVDEIFDIEDLNKLKFHLAKKLNIGNGDEIPLKNTSSDPEEKNVLLKENSEIIPLIKDIYARDFELLGFPYMPPV